MFCAIFHPIICLFLTAPPSPPPPSEKEESHTETKLQKAATEAYEAFGGAPLDSTIEPGQKRER